MDLVTARHQHARRPRGSSVTDDAFPLGGGLNLVDSPLNVQPGELLACKNYEPGPNGVGYRRVKGFERYAQDVVPSSATYTVLNYSRATLIPVFGNLLAGQASGAQGFVLAVTQAQPVTVINLARRSEEFEDFSVWTLDGATIAANNIANPLDGALSAEWIAETTANTEHGARQTISKDATARRYWLSVYVRPRGGTAHAALRAFFNISQAQVIFDFASGGAGAMFQNGDFQGLQQYMLQLTDGWWRIGIKFQSSVQPSVTCQLLCGAPGGGLIYPGATDRGLEAFGFQVEETTAGSVAPSAYVPTDGLVRGNGAGQYALLQVLSFTGVYQDGERLQIAGVDQSEADGASSVNGAATDELDAEYRALSRTLHRSFVTAIPGSGPIRGAAIYKGIGYALRDNAGGTAGVLYRSATNAWNAVNLGRKLRFTGGLPAGILDGDIVTGVTSGASGTVRRVAVTSGAFATSDAAGFLIFAVITGTFQNGEALRVAGTNRAAASGADFAQTLAPGGRLEKRVHNFYGHTSTLRLYGVDGKNKAFEYQDSPEFFCQIDTGMTIDTPSHLGIHNNQLFLGFPGGSLQRSSVGDPPVWSVTLGATEMAVGDEITAILEEIGDTLFVFTRSHTYYVLGDVSNYALKKFSEETGAHAWTVQRIGQGIYLDDRGFTSLSATQRFGNYAANSFTAKVEPLVQELRAQGAIASCVVKNKNLYRAFFPDGRFLSIGVNGSKITGITSGDLGKVVRCVDSAEDKFGNEMILFGSDDGFIYRMESGPSFDGEKIQAFFRTAFHHSRSPQRRKRYRRAAFHVDTRGKCSLSVGTDYSFADPNEAIERIRSISLNGGGGLWDVSKWNEFRWSTGVIADTSITIDASGTNIGFLISHEAADEEEHTVSSIMLALSPRRRHRGASHG